MHEIFASWSYVLQSSPAVFITLVFLFGLAIGSFLNVVIHRVPIMLEREWKSQATQILAEDSERESTSTDSEPPASSLQPPATDKYNLFVPRSACPKCGAQITATQNIPVISYLLLRGKCATCATRISVRYPIVEFVTALLSAAVAWRFGFNGYTFAALILTWSLIALTVIDFDTQLLPDDITLPLLWLGLLMSLGTALPDAHLPVDPRSSIVGAVAGYLSLWGVFHLFKWITGKEGMGYGDFKLFAALGAWLGWQMLPLIILLSAFTGAVVGITLIIFRGRDKNIPIPFGPYLAAAGWIALMYGEDLVHSYLRLTGLR